eukprot:Opistho-2@17468
MLVCTLWVLFIDDVQILALPKSSDKAVGGVSFAVFLLFILEFVLLCVGQKFNFIGKLFFFLDLLAILSLLPSVLEYFGLANISAAIRNLALARAGRAARAGARAGRIMRISRISRLFRKREAEVKRGSTSRVQEAQTATRVGARLQTSTSNKYTVALLLLLLIFNLTSDSTDNSSKAILSGLQELCHNSNLTTVANYELNMYIDMFPDIMCVVLPYTTRVIWGTPEAITHDLRDIDYVEFEDCGVVYFDVRASVRFQATLSIVLTICLILFLYVGNYLFQRDLRILVLDPISKMAQIITGIAENPLLNVGTYTPVGQQDETGLLMTMITKLGYLLQVAFGHAGSQIISENMSHDGDLRPMVPGHKINAVFGFCDIRNFTDVTEGLKEKVMVFVNSVAEIVHEGVHKNGGAPNKNIGDAFLLVWRAADGDGGDDAQDDPSDQPEAASSSKDGAGVSSIVASRNTNGDAKGVSGGVRESAIKRSSNRSAPMTTPMAGDWNMTRRRMTSTADQGQMRRSDSASMNASVNGRAGALGKQGRMENERWAVSGLEEGVAGAVHSYLEIQEELNFSPKIKEIESAVCKFLPNYRVRMGFGFHVGWAIEGPIGSKFKVDASYLSPHVNIAARLESATKMYGVGNLVSGQFHALLSESEQRMLIRIDLVMLKGSNSPVYLHTLNPWLLDATGKAYFNNEIYALSPEQFEPVQMAATRYERAVSAYIEGSWRLAKELLSPFAEEEGHLSLAAKVLLDFMELTNYTPPREWTGVRALTEK